MSSNEWDDQKYVWWLQKWPSILSPKSWRHLMDYFPWVRIVRSRLLMKRNYWWRSPAKRARMPGGRRSTFSASTRRPHLERITQDHRCRNTAYQWRTQACGSWSWDVSSRTKAALWDPQHQLHHRNNRSGGCDHKTRIVQKALPFLVIDTKIERPSVEMKRV